MEEKERIIIEYLQGRQLNMEKISKRQMADLHLVYDTIVDMKLQLEANIISVKNVSLRTQKKDSTGRSICLATYYNNSHLLADFVEFLNAPSEITPTEELNKAKQEIARLKEINLNLIKRDIKFESMQAEIDALRAELKYANQYREVMAKNNQSETATEKSSRIFIKTGPQKNNEVS